MHYLRCQSLKCLNPSEFKCVFLLYFVKDKLLNCCKAKCERNQQCSLRSSPALPFYMLSFRCCRQNVLMLDYQMTVLLQEVYQE